MRIKFTNIIIQPGYINAEYEYDTIKHFVEFKLSDPILVRHDIIAFALACLCGTKFESIFMDLKIKKETKNIIEKYTNSQVKCHINHEEYLISKSFGNHTLNFGGGFDSIAALALMPENTSLVSLDFGKHFSSKVKIMNQFDSHIVKTNLLDTDFRKNSWLFMTISSILYKDYLNSDFNIMGTVLSSQALSDSRVIRNAGTPGIIKGVGMNTIPYTLGLTEFGTLRLAAENFPEYIDDSLKLLAFKGTEKRYRKQLYLEIENERFNTEIIISDPVEPLKTPPYSWGTSYQIDHHILYILKFKGYEVAQNIVSDIPKNAMDLVSGLSLDFYIKYHPDNIKNIPINHSKRIFKVLKNANITPYTDEDLKEYELIKNYLSSWYKVV